MKQTNATRRLGQQLQEKLGYILLFEVATSSRSPEWTSRPTAATPACS